jgi:dipeptidyl aminopeptidase/acylaminoacyl peptidase
MPNIRGSIDRGALWVAGLGGAWGEADVADVLSVADALLAEGWAEPGRIGVMGLSYGGFLTQYLIGVTDRFAAAVAENGVTNQIGAWAGSDLGPSYNASAGLPDPLTLVGASRLWRASPLRYAAAIRTPLLMLQGGDDRTCPASDNEQLFVALRSLGRTVEYVIYPEESHLMQATGRIDRRIDRHRRVVAWFDTHLGRQAA